MPRTIEIVFPRTGNPKIETKGFAGGGCVNASKFIEKALGRVVSESKTAEFLEEPLQEKLRLADV